MKILPKIFIGFLVIISFLGLFILFEGSNEKKTDTWGGIHLGYNAYDPLYTDGQYQWLGEHADFLILHEDHKDKISLPKSINPDLIILCYKSNTAIKVLTEKNIGDYFEIDKHEDWFLHDTNGKRITDVYTEFTRENVYLMNYGNEGWREYATEEMLKVAIDQDWDGIYLDGMHVGIQEWWAPNGLKEYSSDEDFNKGVLGFLKHAHPKFKAKDKLLMPNGAEVMGDEELFRKWIENCDGIKNEGFVNVFRWGREQIWENEQEWEKEISELEYAGEKGKLFFAMAHNRGFNKKDLLYNLASYLIGKKNEKAFFYNGAAPLEFDSTYTISNYISDYSLFENIYTLEIGHPLGHRHKKDFVWQRDFSHGKVLVNPSYTLHEVNLEKTYKTLDGQEVNKILLGDHEGAILLNLDS